MPLGNWVYFVSFDSNNNAPSLNHDIVLFDKFRLASTLQLRLAWPLLGRVCRVGWRIMDCNNGSVKQRYNLKGTFRENQMNAKVYIVIPIEKQILTALRNRFPFLDRTSQRQDMEKNIWTDFNFNTLLFLCFVVGEQMLQIFVIVRRLVVGEHWWVCCVWLLELSLKILLYWFIHVSTIDYDQEKWSALTTILGICLGFKCEVMAEFSVCRLWLVRALFKVEKYREMLIIMWLFVLYTNDAVRRYPVFSLGMPL